MTCFKSCQKWLGNNYLIKFKSLTHYVIHLEFKTCHHIGCNNQLYYKLTLMKNIILYHLWSQMTRYNWNVHIFVTKHGYTEYVLLFPDNSLYPSSTIITYWAITNSVVMNIFLIWRKPTYSLLNYNIIAD